jgi:pimeloyl-ACP methyl ester carboxylesterase
MQEFPGDLAYKLFYQLTREELFLPKKWPNIPTLSIFGTPKDEAFFQRMEEVTQGMEFEIMPMPCGHYLQMEKPDLINEMILNFALK